MSSPVSHPPCRSLASSARPSHVVVAAFTSPVAPRALAANLPPANSLPEPASSPITRVSSQQSSLSQLAPLLCPVPAAPPPPPHCTSPLSAARDARAVPREPVTASHAQSLQPYQHPQSSYQRSTPSVTPSHTMPPLAPHMPYGLPSDPTASVTPPSVATACTPRHTYLPAPSSVAWNAANAPPSPIPSQVLPQPQYVAYMRSAAPGAAYYVYPPAQSQYVPHPAYYAPNYPYSTVPHHQQRPAQGAVPDPPLSHTVATPTMAPSHLPMRHSVPVAASQQQPQLMPVPLYVSMPQYPFYSQPLTPKKRRLQWTPELHSKFVKAVEQYGIDDAVPKLLLRAMNVPGLTRENVASHLQKYREGLRKKKQALPSLSDPGDTDHAPVHKEARSEAASDGDELAQSRKRDVRQHSSSSKGKSCESSDVSSTEHDSCIRAEGGVHGSEGQLSSAEQALKKRRCWESPT